MPRVEIRDAKNHERLLGSVERPRGRSPRLDGGDCYNMAILPPRTVTSFYDAAAMPSEIQLKYVRFGFRAFDWKVVMITDAPLTDLMQLEGFRLPGETDDQAAYRHYHY
jgi:hypothetical protein